MRSFVIISFKEHDRGCTKQYKGTPREYLRYSMSKVNR